MASQTPTPRRVLLFEDQPDQVDLYCVGLPMHGFQVEAVRVPAVAGEAARHTDADAIVYSLTDGFVWEVCEEVRAATDRPIVLLTPKVRPDGGNRRRTRELGLAAFVAKPCTPEALARVLSRVLSGERGILEMHGV